MFQLVVLMTCCYCESICCQHRDIYMKHILLCLLFVMAPAIHIAAADEAALLPKDLLGLYASQVSQSLLLQVHLVGRANLSVKLWEQLV